MNETEDKTSDSILLGLPPPPPMPDLLFTHPQTSISLSDNDREEDLDKIVRRLTDAEKVLHTTPYHVINTHLRSQLQDGPKCGLVALSMASSMTDNFKSADELFSQALKQGYTTQGEMYSCKNLVRLIHETTKFNAHVIDGGIKNHLDCIFQCLQQGGLILVPYDADCNHSPCCKRGHSAHWAVVTGVALFTLRHVEGEDGAPADEDYALGIDPGAYPPCRCFPREDNQFYPPVRIVRNDGGAYVIKGVSPPKKVRDGRIYLFAKQGKSRFTALWSFDRLAESNSNLVELSEQQRTKNFVLPDGGVLEGLRNRAVLIDHV